MCSIAYAINSTSYLKTQTHDFAARGVNRVKGTFNITFTTSIKKGSGAILALFFSAVANCQNSQCALQNNRPRPEWHLLKRNWMVIRNIKVGAELAKPNTLSSYMLGFTLFSTNLLFGYFVPCLGLSKCQSTMTPFIRSFPPPFSKGRPGGICGLQNRVAFSYEHSVRTEHSVRA